MILKLIFALSSILLINGSLHADESILTLTVSGMIKEPPYWQDGTGRTLDRLEFEFSGIANLKNKNRNIDSDTITVKLVNAENYPALVNIVQPGSCTIGNIAVQDDHVTLISSGVALKNTGDRINFGQNQLRTMKLQFDASGGYGTTAGLGSVQK